MGTNVLKIYWGKAALATLLGTNPMTTSSKTGVIITPLETIAATTTLETYAKILNLIRISLIIVSEIIVVLYSLLILITQKFTLISGKIIDLGADVSI